MQTQVRIDAAGAFASVPKAIMITCTVDAAPGYNVRVAEKPAAVAAEMGSGMIEHPHKFVESAMAKAKAGEIPYQTLMWTLAASRLIVPTSDADYAGDFSKFAPLLVGRNEATFLVAFSSGPQIDDYAQKAGGFVELYGWQLFTMMPGGVGMVINPGQSLCLEIGPEGISAIREEI